MMKLYGAPPTRALRVIWLLNEKMLERTPRLRQYLKFDVCPPHRSANHRTGGRGGEKLGCQRRCWLPPSGCS